jgi:hypothetical protein
MTGRFLWVRNKNRSVSLPNEKTREQAQYADLAWPWSHPTFPAEKIMMVKGDDGGGEGEEDEGKKLRKKKRGGDSGKTRFVGGEKENQNSSQAARDMSGRLGDHSPVHSQAANSAPGFGKVVYCMMSLCLGDVPGA